MSTYHGSYEPLTGAVYLGGNRYANKGVKRVYRVARHLAAQERNRLTEHGNTRAHREGRCGQKH